MEFLFFRQFGLSIFISDSSSNSYTAHTYNFYICPRSFGGLDPRFVCQASSLEFLSSHNFDFNKVNYIN
jgi:poly(A)-specific ribonuclease